MGGGTCFTFTLCTKMVSKPYLEQLGPHTRARCTKGFPLLVII